MNLKPIYYPYSATSNVMLITDLKKPITFEHMLSDETYYYLSYNPAHIPSKFLINQKTKLVNELKRVEELLKGVTEFDSENIKEE